MNNKQDWVNCIKISDDKGKVLGDKKELQAASIELGIESPKEEETNEETKEKENSCIFSKLKSLFS
jgi:hypothetical protein